MVAIKRSFGNAALTAGAALLSPRQSGTSNNASGVNSCQPNFAGHPVTVASSSVSNWWTLSLDAGQSPIVTSTEAPLVNFTFLPVRESSGLYTISLIGVSNNTLMLAPNSNGNGLTLSKTAGNGIFGFICQECNDDNPRPVALACQIYDDQSNLYLQDSNDGGLSLVANTETSDGAIMQDQQFDLGLDAYVY